ncbi:peroxidasin homolog isoform X1 [Mizuhopecten yessoensis]|uniref:peroxidasin homolog isoform X1 n=1 Tax=Mizuhopecten yessoensis TaxID=6573 RepID=UPI000B45ABD0|nr:peroxidasin homolog isoform X1 [Mizuhopecten yessoensis]
MVGREMKILLFLSLCVLVHMQEYECPTKCVCFRTTVRCMFLQLDTIPSPLPPDTTVLDLRFNTIRDIPSGSFIGLNSLSTLLLNNNAIQRLLDGAFDGLPELKYLYLYKNQITSVESKAFRHLRKLEQVFMHNNNISSLPEGLFDNTPKLQRLRLDENPVRCDCDLLWVSRLVQRRRPRVQITGTCHSPQRLLNRPIGTLNERQFNCGRYVAPVLTRQPVDHEAVEGSTSMFRCTGTGTPTPVISWFKDDELLALDDRVQVYELGALLRFSRVVYADQGVYTCKLTNTAGTTEAGAELRITQPTQTQEFPANVEVETFVGTNSLLECATDDFIPQYRWIKDQELLQSGPKYSFQGNRLVIRNIVPADAGKYECFAEGTVGFNRKAVLLKVKGDDRTFDGDVFVRQAIREATNRVNVAINDTQRHLFDRSRQHTVQDLIAIFRYPAAEALELARAEEIFEQTLDIIVRHVREGHNYDLDTTGDSYRDIISPGHLTLIANMSGCFANPRITKCSNMCYHKKYRTMDGTCNNLQEPLNGATVTAFSRLLPPIYENGFNTPVGWSTSKQYNGVHLPSPRLVSSFLMSTDHVTEDETSTHMLMQWGQFADHDITLTPQSISYARFSDGRRCNETCDNEYPCFPIPVPRSDSRIQSHPCLGFARSSAMCNSGSTSIFYKTFSARQQINAITAFIDASNVYGSSEFDIQRLRELTNSRGLLREGPVSTNRKRLLPFDNSGFLDHADCQIEPSKQHVPCFRAGDHRVNEHLALTAMHTLWMRQHNHVANGLGKINVHWDGNMIFHEARKIIGSMMQHITYNHWLPNIIGPRGMDMLGPYKGYDPKVDPTITNEFATAAMRFGHALVQPVIFRLNASFYPISEGNLQLHKAFFSPYRLLEEGGIDPLLRGMFAVSAKKRMPSEMMNSELTEKLFSLANVVAQDLASLNIQRGRDHGLPFYNAYRELCGMSRAASFADFQSEITSSDIRDKLQALYGHPDNIDLFVGGMSETPLPGAKVGPTFMCILVDQFKRIREGDRFWYENPNMYDPEQIHAIKQTTLARVICDSSDSIDRVQQDVFARVDNYTQYLPCNKIPSINLKVWSECCADCNDAGDFQTLTSKFQRAATPRQSHREDREHVLDRENQGGGYQNTMASLQNMKEGMSVMESRMEGMEGTINSLTKTLKYLRRKMKKMHRHMKKHPMSGCLDEERVFRSENQRWRIHDCKDCICKGGRIECETQMCPLPTCDSPRKISSQCCPVC